MAKNTPKDQTQPENEDEALAQNPNSPEQAQQETQQQQDAENAALQAETAAREAQATLLAAQQAASAPTQPETPADPRQIIEAMSANGDEFWRGGVLFNGAWQTVYRAEVGDEAWQRIVNEPRLRIKAADEHGA